MIYDISPPLSDQTNVWPGDTPFTREMVCDMANGANITLSAMRSTVHLGSHIDGANHYSHPAAGVDAWELDRFLGPCAVVDATVARSARVRIEDIAWPQGALPSRVLVRTRTFADFARWNSDFAAFSPELVDWLGDRGVRTVGIDTPSVDLQDSKDLPAHQVFAKRGMAIIEGLVLADVPVGMYELIALPLRLVGFDASPVRAVLRTLE